MAKRGRKKKRGRPKLKKISSKKKMRIAKDVLGKGKHRKFVHLKCNVCKEVRTIHVNNKSIYTDEVKKNFVCILCKRIK